MLERRNFLGRGWAFPPEFVKTKHGGEVMMVEAREDIEQSLGILLRTSLGERVMQPDFGCNLGDYQFDPMNTALLGFMKDLVYNAILYYEPRIQLENLEVSNTAQDAVEGSLRFQIDYIIRSTNSRFNFVYDYYVNESASSTPK